MKVVWESLVKGAVVAGIAASAAAASIDIAVKTDQGVKKISPYL